MSFQGAQVDATALRAPAVLDFAAVFADWSAGLEIGELPPGIIEAARGNLFDTLACAAAGRNAPGVCEVRDLALGWGGRGEASLWWSDADRKSTRLNSSH